jgi:hypothetical protein
MNRLIFLNRFFFPDHSATSQILSDLTFHLAASGREVHVITGLQLYDDPQAALPAGIFRTDAVRSHLFSASRLQLRRLICGLFQGRSDECPHSIEC